MQEVIVWHKINTEVITNWDKNEWWSTISGQQVQDNKNDKEEINWDENVTNIQETDPTLWTGAAVAGYWIAGRYGMKFCANTCYKKIDKLMHTDKGTF
jgi:hypothetical protein